jgi:hypothetical protein
MVGGLGQMGMGLIAMPGNRRRVSATPFLLMVAGVLILVVGCGISSHAVDNGTLKGMATVTGTGTSGNAVHTTTFSLTVN